MVGALGLTVLRPTIRQLLAYLLIRAKAPMTSRDRVLSLKITSCVGYGAKNGVLYLLKELRGYIRATS